ncbi:SH3 domain-containing protein [Streptomyces sp. VTCC 41912]|uniref:SH3 domain-containing protein n=1 Tax=Streptomyces sp. VTCC 41912 TaxID=3383243 RepID=UPI003896E581
MTHLSPFRRGAAVLACAGFLCGVLGTGTAAAARPAGATAGGGLGPSKGRVIAKNGLELRDGPGTAYRAVGSLPYGTVVTLRCKVNGENVHGNPRWYEVGEGRITWLSARYVETLGTAPRWCADRHR